MSVIRNKQRLIHLYRYLMEQTDEEHQATTNDLVEFLRREDANASRKTVKDDIEILAKEGVDIIVTKSFYNSYFIGSRRFVIPEIRILIDSILPNRSISRGKKEVIIGKLLSLLSAYQAEKIEQNLYFGNDSGSMNEQLYYNIDRITEAINANRMTEFVYFGAAAAGSAPRSKAGERIVMTPVMIRCDHDLYYVCGYREGEKKPSAYRLDWVTRAKVLPALAQPHPSRAEVIRFLNSLFDMETGVMTEVTLECSNELSDMIRERFEQDAEIWKSTQESFYVKTAISVSPAFYSWIFRYSPMIKIVSPIRVREEYIDRVRAAAGITESK